LRVQAIPVHYDSYTTLVLTDARFRQFDQMRPTAADFPNSVRRYPVYCHLMKASFHKCFENMAIGVIFND